MDAGGSGADYLDILRKYWGYDSFRGIQQQIIESIGSGRDTLGLMPTGGGKSVTFQVPAMVMKGICIVVTPLIALMKDQVSQLKMKGIKAAAVYSGMTRDEIVRTLDNCILGGYKFLYVSPERLSTDIFIQKLIRFKSICMICVDEAHCISQWGYDFRPSYLKIADIRNIIGDKVPFLALTATATPIVVEDIQKRLRFRQPNVFSMSFERKNIAYVVRRTENKDDEMLHILNSVTEGSAIVYTRSRRLTSQIASFLVSNGITADNYHAGLTNAEKDLRQINWTKGRNRVMVATNAFGMGIDKPDVRLVIHYSVPDSVEAYFQEAGRAGRDGKSSYAVLLYNPNDVSLLKKRVGETYPSKDYVRDTYENVCYFLKIGEGEGMGHTYDFNLEVFCRNFKQFALHTDSALKLLSNAGYIDYQMEQEFKSRIKFTVEKPTLYRLNSNAVVQDSIIQAILRTYTGVFADYVYIEETLLAHLTGLTVDCVYENLKLLSEQGIISFIPHRNTPTIEFLVPRVDKENIALYPSVYDDRKADFERRIMSVVDYVTGTTVCRSRYLLLYFGEKGAADCGKCDVCRSKSGRDANSDIDEVIAQIVAMLDDGQQHNVAEFNTLNVNRMVLRMAIRHLMNEEILKTNGVNVWIDK